MTRMSALKESPSFGVKTPERPVQENPDVARAIVAQEIASAVWPAFCRAFTAAYHGVCTTVERVEEPERRRIECIDRPLQQIVAVTPENGGTAIHVKVGANSKQRTYVASGPHWVRVHYNGAGIPTLLEIGYEDGRLTLRFTGPTPAGSVFTENSWGE